MTADGLARAEESAVYPVLFAASLAGLLSTEEGRVSHVGLIRGSAQAESTDGRGARHRRGLVSGSRVRRAEADGRRRGTKCNERGLALRVGGSPCWVSGMSGRV